MYCLVSKLTVKEKKLMINQNIDTILKKVKQSAKRGFGTFESFVLVHKDSNPTRINLRNLLSFIFM